MAEKTDSRYEAQDPKMVMVEADKTATVKFKNIIKKWSVKIVKKDSETGKAIPYADAEFQIHYPNGRLVSMNSTVNIPKTGDDTNLSLWLSIGAVAIGGVISFLIVKFRRKDEDDDELIRMYLFVLSLPAMSKKTLKKSGIMQNTH